VDYLINIHPWHLIFWLSLLFMFIFLQNKKYWLNKINFLSRESFRNWVDVKCMTLLHAWFVSNVCRRNKLCSLEAGVHQASHDPLGLFWAFINYTELTTHDSSEGMFSSPHQLLHDLLMSLCLQILLWLKRLSHLSNYIRLTRHYID